MNKQDAIKSLKNIVEYWTYRPTEVEAAKLAISALEKQLNNGWIPCSERMPTEEESKLYRGEFIIQTKEVDLPYVALWNRIKEVWQDDYKEIDEVIAWQPLPEPYEETPGDEYDGKAEYKEAMMDMLDVCDICDNDQLDICPYIENDDRESCPKYRKEEI